MVQDAERYSSLAVGQLEAADAEEEVAVDLQLRVEHEVGQSADHYLAHQFPHGFQFLGIFSGRFLLDGLGYGVPDLPLVGLAVGTGENQYQAEQDDDAGSESLFVHGLRFSGERMNGRERARGGCAGWGGGQTAPSLKLRFSADSAMLFPLVFRLRIAGKVEKKNAVGLCFRLFFIDLQCRTAAKGRRLTPLWGLSAVGCRGPTC